MAGVIPLTDAIDADRQLPTAHLGGWSPTTTPSAKPAALAAGLMNDSALIIDSFLIAPRNVVGNSGDVS